MGPGVVAGDADKDTTWADFAGPHLRRGLILFEAGGEDTGFGGREVAGEMPVAFVRDFEVDEAGGERMTFVEHPVARAVAIFRGRDLPRGTEARRKRFNIGTRVHRVVDEGESAAAGEEGVDVRSLLRDFCGVRHSGPRGVVAVEDDEVGFGPLFVGGPVVGLLDLDKRCDGHSFIA